MKMEKRTNKMTVLAAVNLAEEAVREENPCGTNHAVLTYKNVDRLKHEVAFHNPNHFTPDEMLNHILNRYFKMVEEVRKTS